MNIKRKQTNASFFLKIHAAVHVIWHDCVIIPSSGATRSLVATLTQWCCVSHVFVCDVAQSGDVLCVVDTMWTLPQWCFCGDGFTVVMTCCDVHVCCCFVCLHCWVAAALSGSMIHGCFLLRSYYFHEHVALDGCNVVVLNEAIIVPEPCRLLCATF